VFKKIDADGSGMLDLEEIREAVAEAQEESPLNTQPLPEPELQAIVKSMDDSEDGVVDLEEFVEWWMANRKKRQTLFGPMMAILERDEQQNLMRGQSDALFQVIDEDDSGLLDTHEIAWALASALSDKLGKAAMKAEVDQAVREMDDDGSGDINEEEFFDWCKVNQDKMILMMQKLLPGTAPPPRARGPEEEAEPESEKENEKELGPEPEPELGPEPEPETTNAQAAQVELREAPDLPTLEQAQVKYGVKKKVSTEHAAEALRKQAEELFKTVDVDGSGLLDLDEVQLGLGRIVALYYRSSTLYRNR
jgi:Ca2+-binding EF-hand superfamily protein